MLKQVVDKQYSYDTATRNDKTVHKLKVLNFNKSGIRQWRLDLEAVAVADTLLKAGDVLTLSGKESVTVASMMPHHYRADIIRQDLNLVMNNAIVTVTRLVAVKSLQGGVAERTPTVIHTGIPCKVGSIKTVADDGNDQYVEKFSMLLSTQYPVLKGDRIDLGPKYKVAKVEGLFEPETGLQEIKFDIDPTV